MLAGRLSSCALILQSPPLPRSVRLSASRHTAASTRAKQPWRRPARRCASRYVPPRTMNAVQWATMLFHQVASRSPSHQDRAPKLVPSCLAHSIESSGYDVAAHARHHTAIIKFRRATGDVEPQQFGEMPGLTVALTHTETPAQPSSPPRCISV
jgi:hypothetical protein